MPCLYEKLPVNNYDGIIDNGNLSNDEENINKKAALWALLKEKEPSAYRHIRFSILGIWMNWPGKVGRKISVAGYRIVQKIFGFN